MAEEYSGIKFNTRRVGEHIEADSRLAVLNHWVYIFAELGLSPVHAEGAFGNHSYRLQDDTFMITRTGMTPCRDTLEENYCSVRYDAQSGSFLVTGKRQPSSECFLHAALYEAFPGIHSIMHGHSELLNIYAEQLNIAVTAKEHPYGTQGLAKAAVAVCSSDESFFIMKNHGFVATGKDIGGTAQTVLRHFGELIGLLGRSLQ